MSVLQAKEAVERCRLEISLEAKSGLNFIVAASVAWSLVAYIWTLSTSSYNRSILTFIAASLLLPLAYVLSKVMKTSWSIEGNPIEPLGLWLNLAQICYFPFLVFILIKDPDHFVMTLAIITGAHLFPYAWFYGETPYAVTGVVTPLGALILGLLLPLEAVYWIPLFVAAALLVLAGALFASFRRKARTGAARLAPRVFDHERD